MVFCKKGFEVERVLLLLLFGGLVVFDNFNIFYIAIGFIIFGFLFSLGYSGVIFSNCRDLTRHVIA
jgi:hypothetical protein